jgi:hypothetical protein
MEIRMELIDLRSHFIQIQMIQKVALFQCSEGNNFL